ncbi:hypothetical protein JKP88DRAFT_198618 [Tribonema minus]|uniref:PROP1-like PPR domain-containing protein n=1 Tax=Tribonema minus TaxID=303371 RepID=A0A835Z9W4_9STRA|nr:hypothetical protein JKP88DRAFT_198618 [Tribonema minus]
MVDGGHKPNRSLFNAVLRSDPRDGYDTDGATVIELMSQTGVPTNLTTYKLALHACRNSEAVQQADRILASMAAAGVAANRRTFASVLWACRYSRDWRRAIDVFRDMEANHLAFNTVTSFVDACGRAGDLPHIVRWLQRLPSLGLAPSPRMWDIAVSTAHRVGDTAAADALWREAGGAAYFGMYKVLVPPEEGTSRGWTVLVDHPAQQPHTTSTALDLSACSAQVGMIHAALRAEVSRLRMQPVPSVLYVYYMQTFAPGEHAIAASEAAAVMEDVGLHISSVPGTPGLFKASLASHSSMQ